MRDVDTHYKDFREKDKCLENVPSDPVGALGSTLILSYF